jgi:hypothetical protein
VVDIVALGRVLLRLLLFPLPVLIPTTALHSVIIVSELRNPSTGIVSRPLPSNGSTHYNITVNDYRNSEIRTTPLKRSFGS